MYLWSIIMVIVWLKLKWSKRDSFPALHLLVKFFQSLEIRNWEAGGLSLIHVALFLMWPAALLSMASGTLSSCVPGHENFQWQGIYSPRTIKREGNLWRTCPLTVWTTVFINFISNSWYRRWRPALSVKVSSMVMRHTLFSLGLLSPLWHPKLLVKNKVLRTRAGLAQRTFSRVCLNRWIKSIFPLSEGGHATQSTVPKAPLEYLGVEQSVLLHHFTLDRF